MPTAAVARHIIQLRRKSGLSAPKRSALPRQLYPKMVEMDYAKAISGLTMVPVRESLRPLIDAMPQLLASARQSRGDEDFHRRFAGFRVVVENPRGSTRQWVSGDRHGETLMHFDYGYIEGVTGADGDEVDVYLGPDERASWVYIVHQRRAPDFTSYDEDKVMLGFPTAEAAEQAYLGQYDDARFLGAMTVVTLDDFRRALSAHAGGPLAYRADAGEGRRVRDLVDEARKRLGEKVSAKDVDGLARKFASRTADSNKQQLGSQVRAAIGVDVITPDKNLRAMVDHFAAENAALITSLQRHLHDKIEEMATRAVTSGMTTDEFAEQLDDRFNIGESHARLIARDQVGKLYGQVNAERQQELGVTRFIWRTVDDDRVREEHDELEKQSEDEPFSYDEPPDEGLPGEPIQCRCVAEPVFDDLVKEIDEEGQGEPSDDTSPDDDRE